jgi:hypothetical protein
MASSTGPSCFAPETPRPTETRIRTAGLWFRPYASTQSGARSHPDKGRVDHGDGCARREGTPAGAGVPVVSICLHSHREQRDRPI